MRIIGILFDITFNSYNDIFQKTVTKLEQSNSQEGPIKMFFLEDISTVERVLGLNYSSFVDGSFYTKKIHRIPDLDEITDELIFIPKLKKKEEKTPRCEAAILMIHKNCIGRMAFIYQNFDFEITRLPINGFEMSPLEPRRVLWRSGIQIESGEIQVADLKKENSTIIGIIKNEKASIFYFNLLKEKFYFPKISDVEGDFEYLTFRQDGNSFIVFDQGKTTGYWIQKRLITVDELRGKSRSEEIVSKEDVQKALSSAVPMDYVFPGLADFFKDVHEYHLY